METGEETDAVQASDKEAQALNGIPHTQNGGDHTSAAEVDALFATSSSPVDAGDDNMSDRDAAKADVSFDSNGQGEKVDRSLDSNGDSPEVVAAEKSHYSDNDEEEGELQLLRDEGGDRVPDSAQQEIEQQEEELAQGEGADRRSEESREEEEEVEEETRDADSVDLDDGQGHMRNNGSMEDSGDDRRSPSPLSAAADAEAAENGNGDRPEEGQAGEQDPEREQLYPSPEDHDSDKMDRSQEDHDSDKMSGSRSPPYSPLGRVSNIASDQGEPMGSQNFDSDDGDLHSGEYSAREPNAAVQGVVQDVLEKVLAAGAGMTDNGMYSDDDLGDGVEAGGRHGNRYPELEKVELSSEDEEEDRRREQSQGRPDTQQHQALSDNDSFEADNSKGDADLLQHDSEQHARLDDELGNNTEAAEQSGEDKSADADEAAQNLHREADTRRPHHSLHEGQGKPGGNGETGENEKSKAFQNENNLWFENENVRVGSTFTSPRPEYPLNYKNYEVCRVLSPGVKECLILETGEQVRYDCRTCVQLREVGDPQLVCGAQHDPKSAVGLTRDRVKRDLFSDKDRALGSPQKQSSLPVSQDNTSRDPPSYSRSAPSHLSHELRQQALRHADVIGRSADLEERDSHDGSYLWMRQQIPSRSERDVLIFTSRIPKDGHVERESTHTHSSREKTFGSPGRAREATHSPREKTLSSPGRTREVTHDSWRKRVADRSGSSTEASRTGLSGSEVSGSVSSPGAIPNFRTLQDQQVSWLAMYRILEEEHRGELQAQYVEHQRMISDMQRHLDKELIRQHQSVQHKLDKHREALSAASPRQQSYHDAELSSESRRVGNVLSDDSDGEDTHLKLSARKDYERTDVNGYRGSSYADPASALRSPEGRSSRMSPQEDHRSRSEQGHEKRLRGGVYSSPMPIARTKAPSRGSSQPSSANSSMRESGQLEGNSNNNARSSYDSGRPQNEAVARSRDLQEEDVLSPRTRTSLREKHARHLSDLRAYYEAEIQELRDQLTTAAGGPVLSSASLFGRETASERILREENQSLRHKCQDLQDALDDANIRAREMEQRLQGLEIRAADYGERYEESQSNVLKLKNRLEELHAFAKERETMLEEAQARERRQTSSFDELYKAREEQGENQRRDKAALKRLLDKYETLEKEYTSLKDAATDLESKLYETRTETVDLNKMIARLELENKRLSHDNDNMRHRLAVSGSLPITRQDVEETREQMRERPSDRLAHSTGSLPNRQQGRSLDRSARSPQRDVQVSSAHGVPSDDENTDVGRNCDSPLIKAERELRRLQQSMGRADFAPKLQPKKYSSIDSLPAYNGFSNVTIIDALTSPTRAASTAALDVESRRGKVKNNFSAFGRTNPAAASADAKDSAPQKSNLRNKSQQVQAATLVSSPTRFDVGVKQAASRSPPSRSGVSQGVRERESSRDRAGENPVSRSGKDASQSVDATLERIRSGDIVSRPQWEDVYTSLARPHQADNKSASLSMTQEQMLRERIRSIDQIEHRYDELTMEKRKLETQLNKVPSHGRVDRKSRNDKEMLETELDKIDRELGSLRMTLKRYQVLKTTI